MVLFNMIIRKTTVYFKFLNRQAYCLKKALIILDYFQF